MTVAAVRSLVTAGALAASRVRFMPDTPAELARKFEPGFRVTPTIRLLSDVAVRSVIKPDQRDICTCPPRTGKSRLLAVWTTVWALRRSPDSQVVLVSYSDELAQAHSRDARALIQEHGEALGIQVAADKSAVGRWRVEGRRGGLLATGINSGVTGFGADVLILDDVVKDAAEADSAAHRRRVVNEYRSTLATRVHPGGSVLLVMTRWHERDLAGELLGSEPDVWTHTNVPAVAEAGVPDALSRTPGVAMVSALGYTAELFTAQRRTSGERACAALYLGMPSAPSGGLIRRDWLDRWRVAAAPVAPTMTVIAVDPADSGTGDAAGVVAASLGRDGVVSLDADASAQMTSDRWARRAVELAIELQASEIAVESFAAGTTYRRVVLEALARYRPQRPIRVTAWPPKGVRPRSRGCDGAQLAAATGPGDRHVPDRRAHARVRGGGDAVAIGAAPARCTRRRGDSARRVLTHSSLRVADRRAGRPTRRRRARPRRSTCPTGQRRAAGSQPRRAPPPGHRRASRMSDLFDTDATDQPCLTAQGGGVCGIAECPCSDLDGTLRSSGRARLLSALLTPQSAPCLCPRCAAKPQMPFCSTEAEAELAVGHVADWPLLLLGLGVVEFTGAAWCPACGGWAPEFADVEAVPGVPSVILAGGCPVHPELH